jgi:hypothetical protein
VVLASVFIFKFFDMIRPQRRSSPAKSLILGLNISMAIAYLFCGLFLFFSPSAGKILPAEYLKVVSLALVLYGCFRAYRAYLQFTRPKSL